MAGSQWTLQEQGKGILKEEINELEPTVGIRSSETCMRA
jgi:hypothetical protein